MDRTRRAAATLVHPPEPNGAAEGFVPEEDAKPPTRDELLAVEDDLLSGMLAAESDRVDETREIVIKREVGGVTREYFKFVIRPLTDREIESVSNQCTTFEKNKLTGARRASKFDEIAYRSMLIMKATVPDYPVKGQKGKFETAWEAYARAKDCLPQHEAVDRVLKPGEKDAVYKEIEKLSGYSLLEAEETAKN